MSKRSPIALSLSLVLALWTAMALAPAAEAARSAAQVQLADHAAARATVVSPPLITAPETVGAATDQVITIQADASDPDAMDVLTITQTGAPGSLAFTHTPSVTPATATLNGTPVSGDEGGHSIRWEVSDGVSTASTTTALNVVANGDPVVSAPPTASGAETIDLSVAISVSDPDGDPIQSLTAAPLPAGAVFTSSALLTGGLLEWTPAVGQAGDYTITFTVESGAPVRTASASTAVHIAPQDHAPVVTAPSKVTTVPSILLTVNVTASDVDGDAITSLVAQGTQATDLPAGASFMVNASNTEGTLTWTPDPVQVGNYGIDFIATSGALELRTIWVTRIVVNPDRAPVVTAPTAAPGAEGALLTFVVTAADPDAGSPIASLTGDPLPFGATFVSNADHTSGTFSWTPDFAQAGVYPIVFTAVNALSGSATTQVQISNVNRPPVASAGGPYTGVAGVSVSFSAAGSGDPDGDPISFAWDFGDLTTGSGVAPMHVYAAGGTYDVQVTVTDTGSPALSGTAATTASILASLQARAFVSGGNKSIRLGSEKPKWCAEVEPVEGNFSLADVLPSTLFLEHAGNQIPALTGKSSAASDQDRNGIEEMEVCFSKADLRTLFAGLPSGRSTVPVRVGGTLQSGAQFSAPLEVEVYATGSSGSASVYPNPFNPEGTLSFTTSRPGPVRALLYDKSGRLVRTLANQRFAAAGYHDIRIDGRSDSGSRLASGVYFYRLDTVDGPVVGSLSIIK